MRTRESKTGRAGCPQPAVRPQITLKAPGYQRRLALFWLLLPLICLATWTQNVLAAPSVWGRLANRGFDGDRIKATLFFPGQARDGTSPYGCPITDQRGFYTLHPQDGRHLAWAADTANRQFALDEMIRAGVNVVEMSVWGEDFLPCHGRQGGLSAGCPAAGHLCARRVSALAGADRTVSGQRRRGSRDQLFHPGALGGGPPAIPRSWPGNGISANAGCRPACRC